MSTDKKNIIVVGGSYGGISSAHHILKHTIPQLPDKSTYQVILVSPSSEVINRPACPRALISDDMFPQDKLFVSIPKSFAQYPSENFLFMQGTATHLDHTNRQLTISLTTGETNTLTYHALILATGASTPSPLLGLTKDTTFLRQSWTALRQSLPHTKTILIAGGGPAGVETAGELGEHLNGRSSSPATAKVRITLVTSGPRLLPQLRPSLAARAQSLLSRLGVTVLTNTRVVSIDPSNAGSADTHLTAPTAVTLDDGRTLTADLYIPATGTAPNTGFVDALLLNADDRRVETNPSTLRVERAGARVYAIGDCSTFARPAVPNIVAAVPVLGANVRRDLLIASGRDEATVGGDKIFKEDAREGQLVPIGRSKGVGAMMGYKIPGFVVWLMKGRDYWMWMVGGIWSGKQWA